MRSLKMRHVVSALTLVTVLSLALVVAPASSGDIFPCQPIAAGDHVHYSGGDASGHGWWYQGSCGGYSGSLVSVTLYEEIRNKWVEKAENTRENTRPGKGSANRVTARAKCRSSARSFWYSQVSVVVGGEVYGGDDASTPAQWVDCHA
jgi:hypothetical protein